MIRTVIAALALVVPAFALPVATSAAAEPEVASLATVPGVNGPIFYASARTGNGDIYRMNPDGTGQTRLTTDPASEHDPARSPDGQFIVYTRFRPGDGGGEIHRMDADGSDPIRLATGLAATWAPDGGHVIYVCSDGDSEICRMNIDGTDQTALTVNAVQESDPSYSPDGRHIVFVSEGIYRMDADGGNRVLLNGEVDVHGTPHDFGTPSYSPDGEHIAYSEDSRRFQATPDIKRMNADGTARVDLASGPQHELEPRYSPDGRYIVFARKALRLDCRPFEVCGYRYSDIVAMNADGSQETLLTAPGEAGFDYGPSWGPAFLPCQGLAPTITGTAGSDALTGGPGVDVFNGYGGDDVIDGGGGADVICGGRGTDTVTYARNELDVVADVDGATGDDGSAEDGPPGSRDSIGADVERLVGGYGDDALTGGPGADVLTGGPGDDTLSGGGGNDTLTGDSGDDTLLGEAGDDKLRGRSGLDTIKGGDGDDSLDGGDDADTLDGGLGVDTATYAARDGGVSASLGAGTGDDGNAADGPRAHRDTVRNTVERLIGGRGDDVLVGSLVDNRLTGGLGADRLLGRAGRDVLVADDGIADLLIDCGDDNDRAPTIDPGLDPAPVSCP